MRNLPPTVIRFHVPIYQVKLVRDGSQSAEHKQVGTPATAASILQQYLEGANREHFVVLLLDTQNLVIGIHTVTVGTLDASLVHPREVFKPSIARASCGLAAKLTSSRTPASRQRSLSPVHSFGRYSSRSISATPSGAA